MTTVEVCRLDLTGLQASDSERRPAVKTEVRAGSVCRDRVSIGGRARLLFRSLGENANAVAESRHRKHLPRWKYLGMADSPAKGAFAGEVSKTGRQLPSAVRTASMSPSVFPVMIFRKTPDW